MDYARCNTPFSGAFPMRMILAIAVAVTTLVQAAHAQTKVPAEAPQWVTETVIYRQGLVFTDDVSRLSAGGSWERAWSTWLPIEDLPADLRTGTSSGNVFVAVEVDESGKPTECRVLKPSPKPSFDQVVCRDILRNGHFGLVHIAPDKVTSQHLNMGANWETLSVAARIAKRAAQPVTPVMMAPPTLSSRPEGSGWPRQRWEGGLYIDHFPDLRTFYPAKPGRPDSGVSTIELTTSVSKGGLNCEIGVTSGNPRLDEAACTMARSLSLSIPPRCLSCDKRRLPLQVVWQRRGGYIRMPLPSAVEDGESSALRRDPAEPPLPTAYRYRQRSPAFYGRDDFAGLADKSLPNPRASYWLSIDATGRVTACEAAVKRARYGLLTDIFGAPIANRTRQYIRFDGIF